MPARKVATHDADRITITLDSEDRRALTQIATKQDRSLAWIVREALKEYLSKQVPTHAGDK